MPQTLTVVNRFKNLKFKDFRVPWTVFTESVQNDQLALPDLQKQNLQCGRVKAIV